MREVEVDVVAGDEERENILQHAYGVVFAEDKIGEGANGAGQAEIPKGAGDCWFPHFA